MQQEYDEIQSRNLVKSGYNSSKGGDIGTGKEVKIDGKLFATQAAAADYYNIEPTKFNWRLRNGYTPEQAAGLEPWDGAGPKTIVVKGHVFEAFKQLRKNTGLALIQLHKEFDLAGHQSRQWALKKLQIITANPSILNSGTNRSLTKMHFVRLLALVTH